MEWKLTEVPVKKIEFGELIESQKDEYCTEDVAAAGGDGGDGGAMSE